MWLPQLHGNGVDVGGSGRGRFILMGVGDT
jgi:hypothetical protein